MTIKKDKYWDDYGKEYSHYSTVDGTIDLAKEPGEGSYSIEYKYVAGGKTYTAVDAIYEEAGDIVD